MKDDLLVQQIKSGDQQALGAFYEKHREEFIHWIVKDFKCEIDDAKDIYQMAVLAVYQNIHQNKLEALHSSLKTYLFAVGKNMAHEWDRYTHKHRSFDHTPLLNGMVSEDDDGEISDEKLELVHRSLSKLGEPCHQLLNLFYFCRKSMDEISVALSYKNAETTKNQKYKCMGRLRKLYEEEFAKQLT